jgi:predicted nucleotidyltransferase component of viral defense system
MSRVRRNPESPDSVRARLASIATERQAEFQTVLAEFAAERFLYRLGISDHADRFVLKGATLLTLWQIDRRRATWDIDLHTPAGTTTTEMAEVIRGILMIAAPDAIRFDVKSLETREIRVRNTHGGISIRVDAMLGTARVPLQIDIGFGDVVIPPASRTAFPALLGHPSPELLVYSRETVVAEKAEAVVTLGATNSRMKDFYDLCVLASTFDFDGRMLAESIAGTFRHRGTRPPDELPLALTPLFMADPSRAVQWKAFLRRSRLEAPPDPTRVIEIVERFIWPPLTAFRDDRPFISTWSAGGPWAEGRTV